ncbi:MAG: glycosyltransferase family 4 protein [Chitinophagales bacterium]|nr:glycosyltransferase family 4 protein [Chitinophagales bacterium]
MIQIYLDKKSFKNAKIVYACSEMVKQEAVTYYNIFPHRIKVLYPPINLDKFKPVENKTEVKKQWNLEEDKVYFLLVSTSHKRKGLDLLTKVFNQLPQNYVLLVAGTPFQSKTANIKSLGFVKEMTTLYQAADCLLHPAVYEPFGQIISEAFACHLPVIVSNRVGAKELISPKTGQIINTLQVQDWEKAIKNFNPNNYSFENIESILETVSLKKHMKNMLDWAVIKNE